jgi:damage-control phosphatase, subfamily I
MRISSECYDCLKRLAAQASTYATEDENLRDIARRKAEKIIDDRLKQGAISIIIASAMHESIKKATSNPDPYRSTKDIEIQESKILYDGIKDNYAENFIEYLKLSAIGNAIDFFRPIEDVKNEIKNQNIQFAIDDSALLEKKVKNSKFMLYLADNAGEVFFDLPLLSLMRKYTRVVYVVKAAPVQNDITIEDIRVAGVEEEIGEVMTTGTATPGIDFSVASESFKRAYHEADFIFAKGMGYYETLEELRPAGKIFFCLKAKCGPVANSLKIPMGSFTAKLY